MKTLSRLALCFSIFAGLALEARAQTYTRTATPNLTVTSATPTRTITMTFTPSDTNTPVPPTATPTPTITKTPNPNAYITDSTAIMASATDSTICGQNNPVTVAQTSRLWVGHVYCTTTSTTAHTITFKSGCLSSLGSPMILDADVLPAISGQYIGRLLEPGQSFGYSTGSNITNTDTCVVQYGILGPSGLWAWAPTLTATPTPTPG